MVERLLWIMLAGGLGSMSRYLLMGAVQRWLGMGFPYGTFAVNVLGCFLFGVIWVLTEDRALISGGTRIILLAGFMGGFTTFSTFIFESGMMMRSAQWLLVFANIGGQVVLGAVGFFLGLAAGRLL